MDSSNPFSGLNRTRTERKLIDPGIYDAVLKAVKSVQVTDKKTAEKKTKVVFTFEATDLGCEVSQFFSPSMNDLSHLVKFLKTVGGSAFTPEIQGNPDSLWRFCKELEGQPFTIVVTQNNGYNNINSALPTKKPKAEAVAAMVSVSSDEFSF